MALAREAARRGQSMQGYLLTVVTQEARRATNADFLAAFGDRSDGTSDPSAVVEILHAARAERTEHLLALATRSTSAPGTDPLHGE